MSSPHSESVSTGLSWGGPHTVVPRASPLPNKARPVGKDRGARRRGTGDNHSRAWEWGPVLPRPKPVRHTHAHVCILT